jgi:hypothetical protein
VKRFRMCSSTNFTSDNFGLNHNLLVKILIYCQHLFAFISFVFRYQVTTVDCQRSTFMTVKENTILFRPAVQSEYKMLKMHYFFLTFNGRFPISLYLNSKWNSTFLVSVVLKHDVLRKMISIF